VRLADEEEASRLTKRRMRAFYEHSRAYHELLSDEGRYSLGRAFEQYVAIVYEVAGQRCRILDLGCGTGATTRRMRSKGLAAVGVDISAPLLKSGHGEGTDAPTAYVAGDITLLPVRSRSVDCVALHNVIEHVPGVDHLLEEIDRVLDSGGRLIIVSPNLVSPIRPIRHLLRVDGFTTKYYGSSLGAVRAFGINWYLILRKLIWRRPEFVYRRPNLEEFECPDDDAVYVSSYLDLKAWLLDRGYTVRLRRFVPMGDSLRDRLKGAVADRLPWLDKGFCLIATRSAERGQAV
jgi:SAM-dependent methyltransferase